MAARDSIVKRTTKKFEDTESGEIVEQESLVLDVNQVDVDALALKAAKVADTKFTESSADDFWKPHDPDRKADPKKIKGLYIGHEYNGKMRQHIFRVSDKAGLRTVKTNGVASLSRQLDAAPQDPEKRLCTVEFTGMGGKSKYGKPMPQYEVLWIA